MSSLLTVETLCCVCDWQGKFERLCSTRLSKRRQGSNGDVDKLRQRHAGVIGLSACVLAFPYQVPDFMPAILMILSNHVNDPQPIQVVLLAEHMYLSKRLCFD